jgi:transcriptional regulator with XRE-family HTH domain
MRDESAVWQALLRRKGLSVPQLAERLGVTRQHAHRVLTGRRSADAQLDALEHALALGAPLDDAQPLFAVGELDDDGELDLVPAGDAQPLFADRSVAATVARELRDVSPAVCVIPVWPAYAWRNLVAFHAAWGVEPDRRKVFVLDQEDLGIPLESLLDEVRAGLEVTLQIRTQARDRRRLAEIEFQLSG